MNLNWGKRKSLQRLQILWSLAWKTEKYLFQKRFSFQFNLKESNSCHLLTMEHFKSNPQFIISSMIISTILYLSMKHTFVPTKVKILLLYFQQKIWIKRCQVNQMSMKDTQFMKNNNKKRESKRSTLIVEVSSTSKKPQLYHPFRDQKFMIRFQLIFQKKEFMNSMRN